MLTGLVSLKTIFFTVFVCLWWMAFYRELFKQEMDMGWCASPIIFLGVQKAEHNLVERFLYCPNFISNTYFYAPIACFIGKATEVHFPPTYIYYI